MKPDGVAAPDQGSVRNATDVGATLIERARREALKWYYPDARGYLKDLLEELATEIERLQKDAERYRWLRDNPDEQLWSLLADINEGPSEEQPEFDNSANAWDAAIDAAIRALPDQKD